MSGITTLTIWLDPFASAIMAITTYRCQQTCIHTLEIGNRCWHLQLSTQAHIPEAQITFQNAVPPRLLIAAKHFILICIPLDDGPNLKVRLSMRYCSGLAVYYSLVNLPETQSALLRWTNKYSHHCRPALNFHTYRNYTTCNIPQLDLTELLITWDSVDALCVRYTRSTVCFSPQRSRT